MNFNKIGVKHLCVGWALFLSSPKCMSWLKCLVFLARKSLVLVLEYVLCDMYLERDLSSTKSSNMR